MSQYAEVISKRVAICVGGIPGAGKTTLLRAHVEREMRVTQVTGSSIVKTIIAPSSVHDLDGWAPERRRAVREQSIHELRRIQEKCAGRLLVDGHFTLRNRTTGVLEPIFTPEDKAFFKALVLIHPQPKSVLGQRWRTVDRRQPPPRLPPQAQAAVRPGRAGRGDAEVRHP